MVLTMMLNVDKKLKVDTSFFRGKEQGVGATYIGGEGVPGKLGSPLATHHHTTAKNKAKQARGIKN